MQVWAAAWAWIRALGVTLIVVLSLAVAPSIEAVKHGPDAVLAEADHRSFHAKHGHGHEMSQDHHDSTDHDHVSVVLLNDPGMDANPDPQRTLRRDIIAADGTIRDGPRRPPRLMMA